MSMNLIQIQDKLKSLPNDPRVMQMLTAYANGQNPQVPPYLALGELNRRKGEMERAQMEKAGQPPGGTVKDQIEQQAGVMALQQGRQQQAMQQMAQQSMQGAAPAPQGIPQPQPQAQAMAAGGLASLRPGYRSGGIIAFSGGNLVGDGGEEVVAEKQKEEAPSEDVLARLIAERSTSNQPVDSKALMAAVLQKMAARGSQKPEAQLSEEEIREELIKKNPEKYGILQKPIGEDALKRLEDIQAAQRSEYSKRREEMAQSKPGILQLLGQAAMNSRGQKGGSALASILGGYSELSGKQGASQLQQEQDLRMKELSLQQVQAEAMNKVEELKRAQVEGNVKGIIKAKLDLQKLAKDNNISLDKMLNNQLAAAVKLGDTERKAEEERARNKRLDENDKARIAAMYRPDVSERQLARVEKLRKDGKIDEANQLLKDIRDMKGGSSDVGRDRADRVLITDLIRSRRLDLKDVDPDSPEGVEIKAEIAELNNRLKDLVPKSDKVTPIQVPQSMPSGLTKSNASKLLKVGTVYDTAAGPGKWNGTSFDPVK